jgi:hypothetical protein
MHTEDVRVTINQQAPTTTHLQQHGNNLTANAARRKSQSARAPLRLNRPTEVTTGVQEVLVVAHCTTASITLELLKMPC